MTCDICGAEFEPVRVDARYCSPPCRKAARRTSQNRAYRDLRVVDEHDASNLIEESEWLLSMGEHPAHIAKQLGRSPGTLEAAARRHGRPDLAAPFSEEKKRALA